MRRTLTSLPILTVVGLALLAGCSGGSSDLSRDSGGAELSSVLEGNPTNEEGDGSGNAVNELDSVEGVIAASDFYGEATTSDGGRVVVGVDCSPQDSGDILSVGAIGVPVGVYTSDVEPRVGTGVTLQMLPDGRGLGASQTGFDAASYTITFPDLDGGLTLTLEGCNR